MNPTKKQLRVFATSDLHGHLEGLDPIGFDLVLIAGDIVPAQFFVDKRQWLIESFVPWVKSYPQAQFVVIPGNHDMFARSERSLLDGVDNLHFLIDESVELYGLKIYGTPWVPPIDGHWAFEGKDEENLRMKFAAIPQGVDILLTHTPPRIKGKKIDVSLQYRNGSRPFGSVALTEAVKTKHPHLIICGHIHTGDHADTLIGLPKDVNYHTLVFNVSRIDEHYEIAYPPRTLTITERSFIIDPLNEPEIVTGDHKIVP